MTGGRIGKDGIHGATFSSEELHEGSPVTAVQIGDPITQKKMTDFLLMARDLDLYRCITDNGAGGLSSSVGETARLSGGCEMDLKKAPLKYTGLMPWEILISESQERMTLAVTPEKVEAFLALAKKMDVEATFEGVVIANGICPRYSDIDTYHMAACAIDEAIRNCIAVGGALNRMAGLDNFCWCDPIRSEKTPDGEYKLAQLVRANMALYDYTTAYGVPCISGKDSMKNDYQIGGIKISIPPSCSLLSARWKM